VLRAQVEAVLATLPSQAAAHTAELRAVLANEPVRMPEVEEQEALPLVLPLVPPKSAVVALVVEVTRAD
jgi:hypothetical protein